MPATCASELPSSSCTRSVTLKAADCDGDAEKKHDRGGHEALAKVMMRAHGADHQCREAERRDRCELRHDACRSRNHEPYGARHLGKAEELDAPARPGGCPVHPLGEALARYDELRGASEHEDEGQEALD
jgi:hypothetical protein